MQLQPGETFAIVRQLDNPNDTGVYYVRAYIRDAATDELLATLNLTDQGGQRFSKTWTVYSKRSQGFYIAISTMVFTDSGYTTYSDVYAQELDTYLVEQRAFHGGAGGGSGISYKEVKRVVQEVIDGLKLPTMPDLRPIIAREVDRAVRAAEAATEAVLGVNVSPQVTVSAPKVDLGAIIEAVAASGELHGQSVESAQKAHQAVVQAVEAMRATVEAMLGTMNAGGEANTEAVRSMGATAFEDMKRLVEAVAAAPIAQVAKTESRMPVPEIKAPEEIIREIRAAHGHG